LVSAIDVVKADVSSHLSLRLILLLMESSVVCLISLVYYG